MKVKKTGARRVLASNIQAVPRNLQPSRKCAIPKTPHPASLLRPRADSRRQSVTNRFGGWCQQDNRGVTTVKSPARCVTTVLWACTDCICAGLLSAEDPALRRHTPEPGVYAAPTPPTSASRGGVQTNVPWNVPCCLGPRLRGGAVLVRRSGLETVRLTHSAVMWGHLYALTGGEPLTSPQHVD